MQIFNRELSRAVRISHNAIAKQVYNICVENLASRINLLCIYAHQYVNAFEKVKIFYIARMIAGLKTSHRCCKEFLN